MLLSGLILLLDIRPLDDLMVQHTGLVFFIFSIKDKCGVLKTPVRTYHCSENLQTQHVTVYGGPWVRAGGAPLINSQGPWMEDDYEETSQTEWLGSIVHHHTGGHNAWSMSTWNGIFHVMGEWYWQQIIEGKGAFHDFGSEYSCGNKSWDRNYKIRLGWTCFWSKIFRRYIFIGD